MPTPSRKNEFGAARCSSAANAVEPSTGSPSARSAGTAAPPQPVPVSEVRAAAALPTHVVPVDTHSQRLPANTVTASGLGLVGGSDVATGRQLLPSHSHASSTAPLLSRPPMRTVRSRVRSKSHHALRRARGEIDGVRCCHAAPPHSHVSPNGAARPVRPPNSTARDRSGSKAIDALSRGGGPVDASWVQVVPFHCQVSPSGPGPAPPNSSTTPRVRSY